MKLFLIFTILITSACGQAPYISCSYSSSQEGYTVSVTVINTGTPAYDGFTECPGFHNDGYGNDNVTVCNVVGTTPFVPSVVCSQFPNILHFHAVNIGLDIIQHFIDCRNMLTLDLSQNKITEIQGEGFSSNRALQRLNLSNNLLSTSHHNSFYILDALSVLNLSGNPGIALPSNVFRFLRSLRELYLNSCNVNRIEDGWFSNTTALRTLNLRNNPLRSLSGNTFWNLRNLLVLDLSSTELVDLPSQIFTSNLDLQNLNLENNQLTTLDSSIFRNQNQLTTLRLSRNDLRTFNDDVFSTLENLRTLQLNYCNLTELRIEWFSKMAEMRSLSIQGNSIRNIPYETFGIKNVIEEINLSNNNLQVLDATSFAELDHVHNLQMHNNEIYAVDYHFLSQPQSLNNANFLQNNCVNRSILNFHTNRTTNMKEFDACFDNFDKIPVVFETRANQTYRWFSMRWNTIIFRVKAQSNAQLILSKLNLEGNESSSLEIHFGMNRNHETRIYENRNEVWSTITPDILHPQLWTTFVVTWNFNVLSLYEEGYLLPRITHIIRDPFDINFFGIRSEGNNAQWQFHRYKDNLLQSDFPGVVG